MIIPLMIITIAVTAWVTYNITKSMLQREITSVQDVAILLAAQVDELSARLEDQEGWEMLGDKILYQYASDIQALTIDEYDEEMIDSIFKNLKQKAREERWTNEDIKAHYKVISNELQPHTP